MELQFESVERASSDVRIPHVDSDLPEDGYRASVSQKSGVYIICASMEYMTVSGGPLLRLYNAIYVGQTRCLRRRFREHVDGYRSIRDAIVTFKRLDFWYTEAQVPDLNPFEQCLIDALGPVVNTINVRVRVQDPVPAGAVGT